MDTGILPQHNLPTSVFSIFKGFQGETDATSRTLKQKASGKTYEDAVSLSPVGKSLAASRANTDESTGRTARLDTQEVQQLQELKLRDAEVRAHEQAHLSVAGQYARGGASFTYQKGPDGTAYAVGGEVGIDMSKEHTPEATISKMQTIKRAALAPAAPSAADRSIASRAGIMESQARQELMLQRQEEILHTSNQVSLSDEKSIMTSASSEENTHPQVSNFTTFRMISAYQQTAGYETK
jgi:hypothetical protein